jgi:hypothetical protein
MGGWSPWRPEPVTIPASRLYAGGVWLDVRRGLRASSLTTAASW